MTVINLQKHKEEKESRNRGVARCLDCKHEWEAIAHHEAVWLECPKCSLEKGRFVGSHILAEGTDQWVCRCDNDLFFITPNGCFCPNCGTWCRFP
jgi:hypothetical protein